MGMPSRFVLEPSKQPGVERLLGADVIAKTKHGCGAGPDQRAAMGALQLGGIGSQRNGAIDGSVGVVHGGASLINRADHGTARDDQP
ncbi:hypothetical protein CWO90_27400 [Bradyrhizobium sp. Leo121]|nr:hypothetical protein CWO90_27400 [Bradyrhizobium sp. Leo121]